MSILEKRKPHDGYGGMTAHEAKPVQELDSEQARLRELQPHLAERARKAPPCGVVVDGRSGRADGRTGKRADRRTGGRADVERDHGFLAEVAAFGGGPSMRLHDDGGDQPGDEVVVRKDADWAHEALDLALTARARFRAAGCERLEVPVELGARAESPSS